MRIQAYTAYAGTLVITAATLRPEAAASTHFTAASIHEDYCARVRSIMREHKHVGETALAYPAAQRMQTYFPTHAGAPLYALRQLMPAGAPRDIDPEFMLEIMRIRYNFALVLLPAAHQADGIDAEAYERHITYAAKQLFKANSVPDVFIPGDNEQRPMEPGRTEIDIICELGPASARTGVDIAAP